VQPVLAAARAVECPAAWVLHVVVVMPMRLVVAPQVVQLRLAHLVVEPVEWAAVCPVVVMLLVQLRPAHLVPVVEPVECPVAVMLLVQLRLVHLVPAVAVLWVLLPLVAHLVLVVEPAVWAVHVVMQMALVAAVLQPAVVAEPAAEVLQWLEVVRAMKAFSITSLPGQS